MDNLKEIFELIEQRVTQRLKNDLNDAKRDMMIINDFNDLQREGKRTEEIFKALSEKKYLGRYCSEKYIDFVVYRKYKSYTTKQKKLYNDESISI